VHGLVREVEEEMELKEFATFTGFRNIAGNVVAEFKPNRCANRSFRLNKALCEDRLEGLKSGGWGYEQTELALKTWPR
jgi:hypothetical protein